MQNLNIQIERKSSITVQQQLINVITQAISNHELVQGDSLPSINKISKEQKLSRDTVFKAYQKLKQIELVDSTPAKGYFVSRSHKRILLLLDYFSPFKESLHNAFIKNIPKEYSVDLVFHHYNKKLFNAIIHQSIGNYDIYIVMNPDTVSFRIENELKKIEPSKLLLLDILIKNWNGFNAEKYACISQNFDHVVYDQLLTIKDKLNKYKSFVLINTRSLNHPAETVEYFIRFCYDHDIPCEIIDDINKIIITDNKIYFVLRQADLSFILRECKNKGYLPGKDIGIIAYNDSPLYEFISNGISVISTNFKLMGEKAAEFVKNKHTNKEIIATEVVLRGSV